jgi:hypothetical protein
LIATGRSIKETCKIAGISDTQHYAWIAALPAYEQAVRRARAIVVEARVDKMAETAREEPDVNRARLIIDTDKWLASKLAPKVYGDKLDLTIEHRLDIGEALAAARARANVRPMCDPVDVIEGEVIDSQAESSVKPIDKQSMVDAIPDIFS